MNTREDSPGFPIAIMVVAFCYTALFVAYSLGFGNGKESAKCKERHSYHYKNVSWFNRENK